MMTEHTATRRRRWGGASRWQLAVAALGLVVAAWVGNGLAGVVATGEMPDHGPPAGGHGPPGGDDR